MARQFDFTSNPDGSETVEIAVRGRQILARPMINFGTAYTTEQRRELGLTGLLPPAVTSINQQVKRLHEQLKTQPSDLAKNLFLSQLQDRNEILFYRLVTEYLEELLPIIYTPTIGEAIQEFSHWFHRSRGVFLSVEDPDGIEEALASYGKGPDDVDLIVVTDSEGILGIGDQGVGGIKICIGKLAVYTAAAGIHPLRVMPVVLDVGTDNLRLLNDEGYLGLHHARVRGECYDEFIDAFVQAVSRMFPHALLHWEDFGAGNAHRILDRYRNEHCTFNDDIQGTAAVVVAAVLSAVKAKGEKLRDQRIVIHGMGTAGAGIADLLVDILERDGLNRGEAMRLFWGLGSRGLLREGTQLRDFQRPYARPADEVESWEGDRFDLADVVRNVQPTILIGTSAQPGAFTEPIIKDMLAGCDRPIVMPLSNPTAKSEALPEDVLRWTDGAAFMATGSPFAPVEQDGTTFHIAQANNALVFPGIGLGAIAVQATRVTDTMVAAAAEAVAAMVDATRPGAAILPTVSQLRAVSAAVALKVAAAAEEDEVATVPLDDPIQQIYDLMWKPDYPHVRAVSNELTPRRGDS